MIRSSGEGVFNSPSGGLESVLCTRDNFKYHMPQDSRWLIDVIEPCQNRVCLAMILNGVISHFVLHFIRESTRKTPCLTRLHGPKQVDNWRQMQAPHLRPSSWSIKAVNCQKTTFETWTRRGLAQSALACRRFRRWKCRRSRFRHSMVHERRKLKPRSRYEAIVAAIFSIFY